MSSPVPAFSVRQLGEKVGLETPEVQIFDRSCFVDGSRITDWDIDSRLLVAQLFADEHPISVTVVLPPDLPFEKEKTLSDEIVAAGGSAFVRSRTETFDDIMDRRLLQGQLAVRESSQSDLGAQSADAESTSKLLSYLDYSPEELQALEEDLAQPSSSSIIS